MQDKNPELGAMGAKFFAYMQMKELEIVHTGQLQKPFRISALQERKLLYRLNRSGLIFRLLRGVYLVPNRIPPGGFWRPNDYLIIARDMPYDKANYYIGGLTAFNKHGFSTQISNQLSVYNDKILGLKDFGGIKIKFYKIAKKYISGFDTLPIVSQVQTVNIANLAKTILDAINYNKRCQARGYEALSMRRNNMKIWTVDAFTDKPFSGNPAAVMIVQDFPIDEMCQNIDAEMNLSETAFLKPLGTDHFHIRWFTPKLEVKLCGHATLASAHILFEQGIVKGNNITFDSLSGSLFITRKQGEIILDFPLQKTGDTLSVDLFKDLFDFDKGLVQVVQAYDDVIVELIHESLVRELVPDFAKIKEIDARSLIVTAKGNSPYDFVSRVFALRGGINEDPVTGSAHCKLADYWRKKLGKDKFLAHQVSARGGVLGVTIVADRVHLKGQAVTILEGTMRVEW